MNEIKLDLADGYYMIENTHQSLSIYRCGKVNNSIFDTYEGMISPFLPPVGLFERIPPHIQQMVKAYVASRKALE